MWFIADSVAMRPVRAVSRSLARPPGQRREKAGDVVVRECGRAHVQAIRHCRKALPRVQVGTARAPPVGLHPPVVPQAAAHSPPD